MLTQQLVSQSSACEAVAAFVSQSPDIDGVASQLAPAIPISSAGCLKAPINPSRGQSKRLSDTWNRRRICPTPSKESWPSVWWASLRPAPSPPKKNSLSPSRRASRPNLRRPANTEIKTVGQALRPVPTTPCALVLGGVPC